MTDKQKKGYIQASELRAKLTMLGEKLTNKEGIANVDSNKRAIPRGKLSCCVNTKLTAKTCNGYFL